MDCGLVIEVSNRLRFAIDLKLAIAFSFKPSDRAIPTA